MMDKIYNEEYYHNSCGPIPYEEPEHWENFFGIVADKIVSDLHPKTVLDAGCAMGYLVTALRDRGVEAYGIDVSNYAISKVREDIKPFCVVGSLCEDIDHSILPERFDVITSIEVLEHLEEQDGITAIKNICEMTDCVVFSSTPDDVTEPTHINVQQREYWTKLFAQNGFFEDLNYCPTYLTSYAGCYRRKENAIEQIGKYDVFVRKMEADSQEKIEALTDLIKGKDEHILKLNSILNSQEEEKAAQEKANNALINVVLTLSEQVKKAEEKKESVEEELTQLKEQCDVAKNEVVRMQTSTSWRITKPIRLLKMWLVFLLSNFRLGLIAKGFKYLIHHGPKQALRRLRQYINERAIKSANHSIGGARKALPSDIKFSILVPLYNTNDQYLREMIESVAKQCYKNWELCLADGSDEKHRYVEKICKEYADKDSRIHFKKLEENLGISENTNACAAMATGEYIVLLDHDDMLSCDALYENAKAIYETDAEVLYSDEDHISISGEHINPFYKPDWSPDLLYSQMYICHLLVFKRELFEIIGGFRPETDGSQDYDLMLRLSEHTERICHIPRILYSWRESEMSTALSADSKPYAHPAGKRALDEHLKRKYGEKAYAQDGEYTFTYDARFPAPNDMLVSIIIPMRDKWELTDACIRSILKKSSYKTFEILVLDNRSQQPESLEWMEQISRADSRVRILKADMEFNWSRLNNYGVSQANGDVFIFLNNDTLIISEDWIERLCENACRDDIGVVGGLLLYPDDTIQHAGVGVGIGGWADHVFKTQSPVHYGSPFVSPMMSRNVLAVTGACMAVSRKTLQKIGLFDEEFIICGSDVELCIRAYENGLFNRYDSMVRLYHLESKSRDSYIPEIDFKKSDKAYAFYRENGDPFYNVHLDMTSAIPKERALVSDEVNYHNFIKRFPPSGHRFSNIVNTVSDNIKYSICEIEPINARTAYYPNWQYRINLLVPSVDQKHVFGGISTALNFFEELRNECGCPARIITLDAPVIKKSSVLSSKYSLVGWDEISDEYLQLVDFSDRRGKCIPIMERDIFVATGWWTAYNIKQAIHWQAETYKIEINPIVYLIQDFEPGFYAWSSKYQLADSTYSMNIPTLAVMNSSLLREYFTRNGYAFEKVWSFDPHLNSTLAKYISKEKGPIKKKKQSLIYGRPSTPRNSFELLLSALIEWASKQRNADEWEVLSAGEVHEEIKLGENVFLKSIGKLSLEDYAQILLDTYAGVSLMVSPHPSYPPLEMAAFGVKTITNRFSNKDLSDFSDNIISLDTCSSADVAQALLDVCSAFDGQGTPMYESPYVKDNTSFENITEEIKETFEKQFR